MHCFMFRMEYFDDLASGQCADQPPMTGLPAIAVKNLHLTGMKAYCDEFPAARRTTSHVFNSELVSQLCLLHCCCWSYSKCRIFRCFWCVCLMSASLLPCGLFSRTCYLLLMVLFYNMMIVTIIVRLHLMHERCGLLWWMILLGICQSVWLLMASPSKCS